MFSPEKTVGKCYESVGVARRSRSCWFVVVCRLSRRCRGHGRQGGEKDVVREVGELSDGVGGEQVCVRGLAQVEGVVLRIWVLVVVFREYGDELNKN